MSTPKTMPTKSCPRCNQTIPAGTSHFDVQKGGYICEVGRLRITTPTEAAQAGAAAAQNLRSPTAPATPALSQIRAEIERLDKAATPGPWRVNHVGSVLTLETPPRKIPVTFYDSDFIAFARAALPALLSIADMLEQANNRQKWLLRQIIDSLPRNKDWLDPAIEAEAKELSALRSIAQMEEGKTETPV